MSLYVCDHCHAVENTALGNYWIAEHSGGPKLCSECCSGQRHGAFEKRRATMKEVTQRCGEFMESDGLHTILGDEDLP